MSEVIKDGACKSIVLRPSCWFYNAGVMGLLKVLDGMEGVECKFAQDGAVEIVYSDSLDPRKVLQRWLDLTARHPWFSLNFGNEKGRKAFLGREDYYPNQTKQTLLTSIKCFFDITESKSKQPQRASKSSQYRCYFCQRRTSEGKFFDSGFGALLGASLRTFPNAYWMMKSQLFVCNKCGFILRCHHLAFSFQRGKEGIFVNVPHFKVLAELNRYADIVTAEGADNYRRILGMALIEWAVKRSAMFGFWKMSNIEVITASFQKGRKFSSRKGKQRGENGNYINCFDLPPRVVRVLLDDRVAYLIKRINEKKILDLIQREMYFGLEEEVYHALREVMKIKKKKSSDRKGKNSDKEKLLTLAQFLPELYVRVISILSSEHENYHRHKNRGEEGYMERSSPFSQDIGKLEWKLRKTGEEIARDNSSKLKKSIGDMGFRLLEQVRMGNRDEVFYMLLRCFAANKKEFPDALVSAIKHEDESCFRILLYSFLAPILTGDFEGKK